MSPSVLLRMVQCLLSWPPSPPGSLCSDLHGLAPALMLPPPMAPCAVMRVVQRLRGKLQLMLLTPQLGTATVPDTWVMNVLPFAGAHKPLIEQECARPLMSQNGSQNLNTLGCLIVACDLSPSLVPLGRESPAMPPFYIAWIWPGYCI